MKNYTAEATKRALVVMHDMIRSERIQTRLEFATEIGLGRAGVNEMERGSRTFSTECLINVCIKFNVSANWLFLGAGTPYQSGLTKVKSTSEIIAEAKSLLDIAAERISGDISGDKTKDKRAIN